MIFSEIFSVDLCYHLDRAFSRQSIWRFWGDQYSQLFKESVMASKFKKNAYEICAETRTWFGVEASVVLFCF